MATLRRSGWTAKRVATFFHFRSRREMTLGKSSVVGLLFSISLLNYLGMCSSTWIVDSRAPSPFLTFPIFNLRRQMECCWNYERPASTTKSGWFRTF